MLNPLSALLKSKPEDRTHKVLSDRKQLIAKQKLVFALSTLQKQVSALQKQVSIMTGRAESKGLEITQYAL